MGDSLFEKILHVATLGLYHTHSGDLKDQAKEAKLEQNAANAKLGAVRADQALENADHRNFENSEKEMQARDVAMHEKDPLKMRQLYEADKKLPDSEKSGYFQSGRFAEYLNLLEERGNADFKNDVLADDPKAAKYLFAAVPKASEHAADSASASATAAAPDLAVAPVAPPSDNKAPAATSAAPRMEAPQELTKEEKDAIEAAKASLDKAMNSTLNIDERKALQEKKTRLEYLEEHPEEAHKPTEVGNKHAPDMLQQFLELIVDMLKNAFGGQQQATDASHPAVQAALDDGGKAAAGALSTSSSAEASHATPVAPSAPVVSAPRQPVAAGMGAGAQ